MGVSAEVSSHSWDMLSQREADYVRLVIGKLATTNWTRPLLEDIRRNGGLTRANKSKFFELRFGYALQEAGVLPRYEVPGEGASTLDFGFEHSGHNWLVELMRLEEIEAVRNATRTQIDENGTPWVSLHLNTDAEDRRQSPQGETLMAVQRICQKCERDGKPHKFPAMDGSYRAILVDFRTFIEGGDVHDRIHVGLGGEYVAEEAFRMHWEGQLISGVFNERTRSKGAKQAQERVHFLGFVHQRAFLDGGFAAGTVFIANPRLFESAASVRNALAAWPLQPASVLSAGKPARRGGRRD